MRARFLIEGWRSIHHSYALVAQSYALCLLRRDIELRFRDVPFNQGHWRKTKGIFSAVEERLLAQIRVVDAEYRPAVTLTIHAGGTKLGLPVSGRKFVFGTPGYRILREPTLGEFSRGQDLPATLSILTPSQWTATAYRRFGVREEQIVVAPLGFDEAIFRPNALKREAVRNELRLQADDFVFASAGSMTQVKGVDILLQAFARVLATNPTARLLLKGNDDLYSSKSSVRTLMAQLPAADREAVAKRMSYIGGTLAAQGMADIYRAADSYVSPYRAEGFNLPVLEAAACGTAVICTAGGPTDEFTDVASTKRIRSRIEKTALHDGREGESLVPDVDHLAALMSEAVADRDRNRVLGTQAAEFAVANFTWGKVTDLLLQRVHPPGTATQI